MRPSTWNFLRTGENTGEFNMQLDETLVRLLMEGSGMPTVRLYRWKPWAISLGRHQDLLNIDASRCERDGIDIVRRPTGGRAILHAEELTYSVVMPAEEKGIHEVYREISEALVKGLRLFGVDATLHRSQPDFPKLYRNPSSIPCFSSSARYEVEWKGRKIVGSAQRRYSNESGVFVLQHGSILCGPEHQRLADYVTGSDEQLDESIRAVLEEKTADLLQATGREVDLDRLEDCLRQGFETAWGVELNEIGLTKLARKDAYV